ncbi:conserved protein, unknown function [Hepatocystis sp. ex Piliocolobus tephrosceles]|nr:conserved protein, unknown function [Hepatocystis sp. ex Piliocolobus tephrosceles]
MRLNRIYFNIGIFLLIVFFGIKRCKGYILNINVVDKDDLFIFLYKNEHLLASSYYNFKPSYFFSVDEGEIDIDWVIDFKENKTVKSKNKNQEILERANKNSTNILNNFNVEKEYFNKKTVKKSVYNYADVNTKEKDSVIGNSTTTEAINDYFNKDVTEGSSTNKVTNGISRNDFRNSSLTNNVTNVETTNEATNKLLTNTNVVTTGNELEINNEIDTNKQNENEKSNNLFLVLITADQWLNYIRLKNKLEPSLKNEDNYIFTSHFNCIKRYPLKHGVLKKTIYIKQKNRYMLFLINNNKLIINLKGNIIYYDYKTKHLSHDLLFIPSVLYFTTILLLLIVIILSLYSIKSREKSNIIMILNMFFFFLSTYYNYKNVNFIRDTGYMYIYFWVAANILKKIQEIITFIIYLQVSLGDMYIRNHLSRIEIQFMICFSVVSFYTGIFEIFLGNFQAPRYIIQAFAYLFIFIAINFTSTFLSARLSEESLSFHVAELYKKYDIYKKYRVIFFAVILKPIFLIIYKVLCLSPSNIDLYSSHEFLYVFFDISFDIVLYVILFALFRTVKPIKLLKHILSNENFHID